MQALIYITIAENATFSYQVPLLDWAKQQPFDVLCYDFDNHSEAVVADYAIQLLNQADKALVVIEYKTPSQQRNSVIKLLNKAVRQKNKDIKLILNGSNPVLEKMGKVLGETSFYADQSLENQKALCQEFFM
jgi:hypothetical protein